VVLLHVILELTTHIALIAIGKNSVFHSDSGELQTETDEFIFYNTKNNLHPSM
jgi:hypothetical protein